MAKNKKIAPIIGPGRTPEKQTVQKSTPLYALWRSELSLAEFKILDTYLSRIDSHKPEKRTVRFEKGEIEQILGVKKINTADLKERLKHLGTVVEVDDPTKTRSFRLVSLFEQADCEQDENEIWQVDLTCTSAAMKYIFNVENLGYLRYKLRAITSLRSRYSYILFLYLEKNRFRRSWEIGVDELRHILKADEEVYQQFKYFNARLLKLCHKELLEKTECHFTYQPIKKGRSVKAIRFTLETIPEVNVDMPTQITIDDYLHDKSKLWESALCTDNQPCEFSTEQVNEIREILLTIPENRLPPDNVTGTDDINVKRYHYISISMSILNRRNSESKISNRFAYFMKILKNDAEKN